MNEKQEIGKQLQIKTGFEVKENAKRKMQTIFCKYFRLSVQSGLVKGGGSGNQRDRQWRATQRANKMMSFAIS